MVCQAAAVLCMANSTQAREPSPNLPPRPPEPLPSSSPARRRAQTRFQSEPEGGGLTEDMKQRGGKRLRSALLFQAGVGFRKIRHFYLVINSVSCPASAEKLTKGSVESGHASRRRHQTERIHGEAQRHSPELEGRPGKSGARAQTPGADSVTV